MKYKNVLFICLMICIIFSISSVYANDLNNTDIQQKELIINISNSENYILNSNTGTFSDLNNEIQNADHELKLTKNYTYTDGDVNLINGIPIKKYITIDGNGFTINGNFKSRAFNITNEPVILKNINFINCAAESGGAIIYNNVKYGEIINSRFTGNTVESSGGAIAMISSNIKIENCSFIRNSAKFGGAINVDNYVLILNSCNFTGNRAKYFGAAILYDYCDGLLKKCIFKNNYLTDEDKSDYYWEDQYILPGCLINCVIDSTDIEEPIGGMLSNINEEPKYEGEINIPVIYKTYTRGESINLKTTVTMDAYYYCNYFNPNKNFCFVFEGKNYTFTKSKIVKKDQIYQFDINATIAPPGGDYKCDYFSITENTILEVDVTGAIVDITVINPHFYDGKDYFLAIEKYPFPTSHQSLSSEDSLKLYDNHTTTIINYIPIGLNKYRVYYSNLTNDFYYYFNVTKTEQSSIYVNPITGQRGTDKLLKIEINDKSGLYSFDKKGYVIFTIDGKTYNYPVINGESEFLIKLPNKAGTFNYKVTFHPYSDYIYSSSANLKIISKYKTKTTIKSITGYQGNKVKLTATVKDDDGNKIKKGKVIFKINGKTYSANVKKGVASVTIKYPKAMLDKKNTITKGNYKYDTLHYKSTYECSVTFKGDDKYISSSKTFKITSKGKTIKHKYRIYNYRTFTLPVKNTLKFYHKGQVVIAVGMKYLNKYKRLIVGVGDNDDRPVKFKVMKHYKKNGKWRWDNWFYCDEDHYMETNYGFAIKIDKIKVNCYSPYFVKIY